MTFLAELRTQALQAAPWIAGSLVVHVLVAQVAWWIERQPGLRTRPRWWQSAARVGRWVFYVGVPYLALGGWPMVHGVIPASAMGWIGSGVASWTWFEMAGNGAWVGLVVFVGLTLIRTYVARASRSRRASVLVRGRSRLPWWEHLVEIVTTDVHWAFYWAGSAVVLDDGYLGLWAGLGLVYLESALDPFWRRDLGRPDRAYGRWQRAALALGMGIVFWQTRNLWVCISVHWLLEAVLLPLSAGLRSAAQAAD